MARSGRLRLWLPILICCTRATAADAAVGQPRPAAQANRLIVKFVEVGALAGPPDTLSSVGLSKVSDLRVGSGRAALYKYTGAADPVDKAVQVAARPDVLYAEPDYLQFASVMPDDGGAQWPWAVISAPAAWDVIRSASDVTVGVIDTGIQTSHPDLGGKIESSKLWHFCSDCTSVEDGHGHGTHCAGTVGAETDNGRGVAGTAWGVRLAACRFLGATGSGSTSNAIRCIDAMRTAGVQITSNSWGSSGYSQALYDSIQAVCNSGGLFIAAAGNDAENKDSVPNYPSGYALPCVMSIAATTKADGLADFSNYGAKTVDMGAPGVRVLSTWPTNIAACDAATQSWCTDPYSGYRYAGGTSMATPHVAGAAALVSSASGNTLTGTQIKQLLMDSTDPLAALDGKTVSGGRLNLYKAVAAAIAASGRAQPLPSPSPTPPSPSPPVPPPSPAVLSPEGCATCDAGEYPSGCSGTSIGTCVTCPTCETSTLAPVLGTIPFVPKRTRCARVPLDEKLATSASDDCDDSVTQATVSDTYTFDFSPAPFCNQPVTLTFAAINKCGATTTATADYTIVPGPFGATRPPKRGFACPARIKAARLGTPSPPASFCGDPDPVMKLVSGPTFETPPDDVHCNGGHTVQVKWVVEDVCKRRHTVPSTFRIRPDTDAPVIEAPVAADVCSASAAVPRVRATDKCGPLARASLTSTNSELQRTPRFRTVGNLTRTYTSSDGCNTGSKEVALRVCKCGAAIAGRPLLDGQLAKEDEVPGRFTRLNRLTGIPSKRWGWQIRLTTGRPEESASMWVRAGKNLRTNGYSAADVRLTRGVNSAGKTTVRAQVAVAGGADGGSFLRNFRFAAVCGADVWSVKFRQAPYVKFATAAAEFEATYVISGSCKAWQKVNVVLFAFNSRACP